MALAMRRFLIIMFYGKSHSNLVNRIIRTKIFVHFSIFVSLSLYPYSPLSKEERRNNIWIQSHNLTVLFSVNETWDTKTFIYGNWYAIIQQDTRYIHSALTSYKVSRVHSPRYVH